MKLSRVHGLSGEVTVPGDKSISHRSIMLGSIAKGNTEVEGFLQGADCLSSIACFRKMGVEIENNGNKVLVHGRGLRGLKAPDSILNVGNSGTTTRLMSGILAAQPFVSTVNGDASIQKRPMKRIITPLSQMGADIQSLRGNDCTPLEIHGTNLHGIHYDSPVASAQVKSAILLAGLYADGETSVTEPEVSRNHTELMFEEKATQKSFEQLAGKYRTESDPEAIATCEPIEIIEPDHFGENDDYETSFLTYYADGALVFDGESKQVDEDDIPTLIGTEALKHIGEFAPSMIHVRNNNYHKDYEILQAQQCWANVLSEEDE